jgi:hypothetical protein
MNNPLGIPVPNSGDAQIFRQIAAMLAMDRRRASHWAAAMRGTAIVICWPSTELSARSEVAIVQAQAIRERAANLRRRAAALRANAKPMNRIVTYVHR